MKASYRVRRARSEDLETLPEIERSAAKAFEPWGLDQEFGDQPTAYDELERARQEHRLLVAVDDSMQPVGFALVVMIDGQPHLEEMDVDPLHGRQGLGALLLRAICQTTKKKGYEQLTLSTMRDVPFNAPFYAKHGFEVLEEDAASPALCALRDRERERGLDVLPRVLMMRRLNEA